MNVRPTLDGSEHETRTVPVDPESSDRIREQSLALADVTLALKESEDRFQRLMRGAKDYALYMLDASGNVASWNAGAQLIEGYKAEEIVGKHLSTFYMSAELARAQQNLDTAALVGRAEEEGFRVRKDGSTFWTNTVLSAIHDSSGVLIGFAKVVRDLTERKNWEVQLQQAQKLEAIGSLAAGVAHDFNNLLSVILSYSELLASGLKEADPMRSDLREIQTAGLLAVTLTRRLLAFGRQQVLQPKVVDLCRIIVALETMLRRLVGEEVEIVTELAPECGKVLVDPGQIEQVVMNLVVNARDAMPDGGKLTIDASEVLLDQDFASEHLGATPGPHVLLAVSDTGVGMDEATRARIFEPFFTTKEPGKGTGLGLPTVFGIVKQSGGIIEVFSELNCGTKINVYLPMVDRAALVRSSAPPPNCGVLHGSETILLVEDDEQVRVLARTILRRYGYDVLDAQSGGDALLLCEQYSSPIHLLLTDVVMRRMSGRELAERLLKVRPEMRVLYMSGYTDDAVVRHGIFYSKVAFIQKPITPEPLARKVRQALDAMPRIAN
jgi:two-component system, cell cycle sensor histidine kinase and response regulator CckA